MNKLSIKKFVLIAVIVLAALLRLFALSNYPAGFNADEAALGYNAYSLLQTGKDEYGELFPLAFKSFGDYKPGLYVYFVMPFVVLLGLTEFAVRLPSALLGIVTVYLIYLLGKMIFKNEWIGLSSAFLLAISPWHLHFSRGAWETNAATFFITLGVYLFLLGLEKNRFLLISAISFLVSMYLYQSPRLVVPVLMFLLSIIYYKKLIKHKKQISIYVVTTLILSIPLILQFTGGGGGSRFSGLSYFNDSGPINRINELRGEHQDPGAKDAVLLHNKLQVLTTVFLSHYLDHFKGDFLFINGDSLIRNKIPETGQLYLVEFLFLILGLIYLIRNRFDYTLVLIVWILIAPLASSMTYQTPHALRSFNMVIPLTIIVGLGFWVVMKWIMRFNWRYLGMGLISLIITFELFHYLDSYYVHYPKRYPIAWEYGFKEMVEKLEKFEKDYTKIVITDTYDQPYILVLFYKKFDPTKYQPQANLTERDKFNFGTIRNFDKYEFRSIDAAEIPKNPQTLYIGTDKEIPKNANIIDKVNFLDNQPAFVFAKGG
jgi:4-amino-4-deoxy-L-arabinose transferase-like glycosyltransferase